MVSRLVYNLIIEPDFSRLSPILPKDATEKLEETLFYHGCPHPIEVWHKSVLFDFTLYELCQKWEVPFEIVEVPIKTKEEAIVYACQKQLANPSISDTYFRYVIGRAFLAMKVVMSDVFANKRTCPFPCPDDIELIISKTNRSRTALIAAKMFNIAPGTASQYGTYAKAIESLFTKTPDIAESILNKHITLSLNNTIQLSKMNSPEIYVVIDHLNNHKDNSLLHSEMIRRREAIKSAEKKNLANKKSSTAPEIKNMPKYDPDAEVSSLSLTIPTWISSIKRTQSIADFNRASTKALYKLEETLNQLSDAVTEILTIIKEEYYD